MITTRATVLRQLFWQFRAFARLTADPPEPWRLLFQTASCLTSAQLSLQSPRCYPHDVDGIADNIGGALLAFGASGHGLLSVFR
ncbi:MAG: hypothetical protein QOC72_1266 [Methylobacteriaceae bacterium]|jgi:hypothetical protein|nr:hypothetical protein [Methylobacteriaceae bacterium]